MIKAIVFDLDDTLWPVAPVILHAETTLHVWLAQHAPGIVARYSIEDLRHARQKMVSRDPRFAYDLWALRHALLCDLMAEESLPLGLADQAMQVFAHARNQVDLYADVLPGLQQLQKRFVLASLSNGFADLKAIGLASHFQVSLAAHQFSCAKPDPRIFHEMLTRLACSAHEVMVVGDDLAIDVAGAQSVGMLGVWMNRRQLKIEESALPNLVPDMIVESCEDLLLRL